MVSEGEGAAPLPAPMELILEDGQERDKRRSPAPWAGLLAAALLHALVALALIIDWSHPAAPPDLPPPIPVRLVMAPPPPPPAHAPAPPKPAPQSFAYRESGSGDRTTAPPTAETKAPAAASPPPAAPTPEMPKEEKPAEAPPPEKPPSPAGEAARPKPKPEKQVAHLEPPSRKAAKPQAPNSALPRRLNLAPGDKEESGDPYLNRLTAVIEQHRIYPRVMGQFGLPVDGTVTYGILLDRSGQILGIRLLHSSGVAGIDQAGEAMIRASAPFPPPPQGWPSPIPLELELRLFPRA